MNPLAIDGDDTYRPPNDNPELCAVLETYLERARRGDVRSLSIAAIYGDGSWNGESFIGNGDNLQMAGALETVILRLPNGDDEDGW